MLFDTHAHYDDEQFDTDRFELLASLPENGVGLLVNPACNMASSHAVTELAERFPHVYAAVGIHPEDADSMAEGDLDELRRLAEIPKVVAIGEIGLDYHYENSPRDVQKRVFETQLALARELNLPAIVHDREATADTLEIIHRSGHHSGVMHCFSGSVETARELIAFGWYLSFTGVATYKNARKTTEVIAAMPLDRLMIETDSPYLAPVPVRGRRNSSLNLHYIAEKVAELRGITVSEAERITTENALRFFNINA